MSALTERLALKLGVSENEARRVRRAFVETLKEEAEARWGKEGYAAAPALYKRPLVIGGLGSFKMRTRPARAFRGGIVNQNNAATGTIKPPARRLVFTAKWEPLEP